MTRGNGDGDGPEDLSAFDVAWGVADDEDVFGGEFFAVQPVGAYPGDGTEFVAFVMVVGKNSEFKVVPDSVVVELDLGSGREVSGEERKDTVGAFLQLFKQRDDAGRSRPWCLEMRAARWLR